MFYRRTREEKSEASYGQAVKSTSPAGWVSFKAPEAMNVEDDLDAPYSGSAPQALRDYPRLENGR